MIFHRSQIMLILATTFTLSSLAGLAAALRSEQELTLSEVISALLYSGLLGLGIAVVWFNYFSGPEPLLFLLSVSGLAGIGGVTLLDAAVQAVKHLASLRA